MGVSDASRVVAHVDLDCFYVSVEARLDPTLRGVPCAVCQYNPFEKGGVTSKSVGDDRRSLCQQGGASANGSLIAVSYEARAAGVKRNMRGAEARKICPDLQMIQVPTAFGKSDMTVYRQAGAEVAAVLASVARRCEKASVDEVYVDLTHAARDHLAQHPWGEVLAEAQETHVAGAHGDLETHISRQELREGSSKQVNDDAGHISEGSRAWWARPDFLWTDEERALAAGCAIMARLRKQVTAETTFTCSAGVSTNKMLAKLTSGMHKPNQQTVLTAQGVPPLLQPLALDRLRGLGGEFGKQVVAKLGVNTCGELAAVGVHVLQKHFGEDRGLWLWRMAQGMDEDPVKERELSQSFGTGKTFRGPNTLHTLPEVKRWMSELAGELALRLDRDRSAHGRVARLLTTTIIAPADIATKNGSVSHSHPIAKLDVDSLASVGYAAVRRWASGRDSFSIVGLFMSATQFESISIAGMQSITNFFQNHADQETTISTSNEQASPPSALGFSTSLARSRKGCASSRGITHYFANCSPSKGSTNTQEDADACHPWPVQMQQGTDVVECAQHENLFGTNDAPQGIVRRENPDVGDSNSANAYESEFIQHGVRCMDASSPSGTENEDVSGKSKGTACTFEQELHEPHKSECLPGIVERADMRHVEDVESGKRSAGLNQNTVSQPSGSRAQADHRGIHCGDNPTHKGRSSPPAQNWSCGDDLECIDESLIHELPLSIQAEIRAALRDRQRAQGRCNSKAGQRSLAGRGSKRNVSNVFDSQSRKSSKKNTEKTISSFFDRHA